MGQQKLPSKKTEFRSGATDVTAPIKELLEEYCNLCHLKASDLLAENIRLRSEVEALEKNAEYDSLALEDARSKVYELTSRFGQLRRELLGLRAHGGFISAQCLIDALERLDNPRHNERLGLLVASEDCGCHTCSRSYRSPRKQTSKISEPRRPRNQK